MDDRYKPLRFLIPSTVCKSSAWYRGRKIESKWPICGQNLVLHEKADSLGSFKNNSLLKGFYFFQTWLHNSIFMENLSKMIPFHVELFVENATIAILYRRRNLKSKWTICSHTFSTSLWIFWSFEKIKSFKRFYFYWKPPNHIIFVWRLKTDFSCRTYLY